MPGQSPDKKPFWKRWIFIFPVGIFLIAIAFARPIVDFAVDHIYKNVAEPLDGEMPVTVTPYASSSSIVSIIGGRGEGLNCSLPWGVDFLFDPITGPLSEQYPVRQRFRQACVFHDLCYRHGLATYGYSQNDCDQMLQEQAFRLCFYAGRKVDFERCQLEGKKVLAGVNYGGFKSYAGWNTSTYFEFDSNPKRSEHFSAARVISNPFKTADPEHQTHEPLDWIIAFDIKRSGVDVICRNCLPQAFTSKELQSAQISLAPDQLPDIDQERLVWLPLDRSISAPHVLMNRDGSESFVWLNRQSVLNTQTCAIVGDPKKILTHTRPNFSGCRSASNLRLGLTSVDLLSSSPQPTVSETRSQPGAPSNSAIVAFGITTQATADANNPLGLCISPELDNGQAKQYSHGEPPCLLFHFGKKYLENELGAFQNFPIIKGDRTVLVSRSLSDDSRYEKTASTSLIVFDLPPTQPSPEPSNRIELLYNESFHLSDDYDPLLPITKDKNDLKLISMISIDGRLEFYEIDPISEKNDTKPKRIVLELGNALDSTQLSRSWARRPPLVVENTGEDQKSKTQIVLSRSNAVVDESTSQTLVDKLHYEFLVFNKKEENNDSPKWKYVRGAQCEIQYQITKPDRVWPCLRVKRDQKDERATVSSFTQGGQLIVGRFSKQDINLAIIDTCFPDKPIVLEPTNSEGQFPVSSFVPKVEIAHGARSNRTIVCQPLKDAQQIAK